LTSCPQVLKKLVDLRVAVEPDALATIKTFQRGLKLLAKQRQTVLSLLKKTQALSDHIDLALEGAVPNDRFNERAKFGWDLNRHRFRLGPAPQVESLPVRFIVTRYPLLGQKATVRRAFCSHVWQNTSKLSAPRSIT
jgi:hypothetical protein